MPPYRTLRRRALAAATSLLALLATSRAAPLVYEPFDYASGNLAGNEGGTGFAGAWGATKNNPTVSAPDKGWGLLSSAGGHARGGAWSGVTRPLGSTLSDAGLMAHGATLWFSVVMDLEGQNIANADLSLSLGTGGFVASTFGDRENLESGEGIGVTHSRALIQGVYWQNNDADTVSERAENDSATLIDGLNGNGRRSLIVGKIEWGTNASAKERLTLYAPGPALSMGSPTMAEWTTPALDQSQFDTLALQFKDQAQFDEIRFGASFAEVAPAVPPQNLLSPDDPILGGVLNGSNFELGVVGAVPGLNNWPSAEPPEDLINGLIGGGEKYLNFAELNTGVIVTPTAVGRGGRTVVTGMELWVANDADERDPASYAIYGTDATIAGGGPFPLADFTLISDGALALPDDRNTVTGSTGNSQFVPIANAAAYSSYLIVFPTVKDAGGADSMQLSELQLSGIVRPFRITAFSRDGGTADLTFTSDAGVDYAIDASTDGQAWTQTLGGPVIGAPGTATTTVSDLALPAPAPERLLLRVRRLAPFMQMVTVGNPGNAPDTTGDPNPAGAVAYEYRIGKYEVTNAQYAALLNAVAAADPNGLYKTNMGSDARGGITRSGADGGYTYAVKENMGDKPVNFVSWYDALRFCNWLHNGRPSGAQGPGTTEGGAYTFTGPEAVTMPGSDPTHGADGRNAGARYWLPSEDEWYKAAYHEPGASGNGYWLYPTRSDDAPTAVTANASGDGNAGPAGNFANFDRGADWNGQDGNVTTVGTNGGASFYGAFDMGGNVWEWNETEVLGVRGLRGGSWGSGSFDLQSSSRGGVDPAGEGGGLGFRVAGP